MEGNYRKDDKREMIAAKKIKLNGNFDLENAEISTENIIINGVLLAKSIKSKKVTIGKSIFVGNIRTEEIVINKRLELDGELCASKIILPCKNCRRTAQQLLKGRLSVKKITGNPDIVIRI